MHNKNHCIDLRPHQKNNKLQNTLSRYIIVIFATKLHHIIINIINLYLCVGTYFLIRCDNGGIVAPWDFYRVNFFPFWKQIWKQMNRFQDIVDCVCICGYIQNTFTKKSAVKINIYCYFLSKHLDQKWIRQCVNIVSFKQNTVRTG